MERLSVAELFTVNDCLLSATSIRFDYFNSYGKVFMLDEYGKEYSWIVTRRQLDLLKKDYYSNDLWETIELARTFKKKLIKTNDIDNDFPLIFEVYDRYDNLIKSLKCNEEECMYILKCSKSAMVN